MKILFNIIVLMIFVFQLIYVFDWTVDDAYITYCYTKSIINGEGPAFNKGEIVEGFTSPLHLLLLSLSPDVDLIPLLSKITGIVSSFFLLFYLLYFSKDLFFVFLVIAFPSYAVNSVNGLETMLFTLILSVFLFSRYIFMQRYLSLCLIPFMVFIRPEGFVIIFFVLIIDGVFKERKKEILPDIIIFILAAFLLLSVRYYFFAEFLPNTYYVKASGLLSFSRFLSGAVYLLKFNIKTLFIPLIMFVACIFMLYGNKKGNTQYRSVVLVIILFFVIILYEGGDWIPFNRFIIPIIPVFFYMSFILHKERLKRSVLYKVLLAFFILSSCISSIYEFTYVRQRQRGYLYAHRYIAEHIKLEYPPDIRVGMMDIGMVKFYSGADVFDIIGLTNKKTARDPDRLIEFLMGFNPDILILVSNRSYETGFSSNFNRDQLIYDEMVKKHAYVYDFERDHFKFISNNKTIKWFRGLFRPLSSEYGFEGYYLVKFEKDRNNI